MPPACAGASAIVSACGRFRYRLDRRWGGGPAVVWVMLNPSTADQARDDATIRRCIGFSDRLGYRALTVVNLFAFRARDPGAMREAQDPVGPHNDAHIDRAAGEGALTICAWGAGGRHLGRGSAVIDRLARRGIDTHCLRVTGDGSPAHPLMLPYRLAPVPYRGTA